MDDIQGLFDRLLPEELQEGNGWHIGKIAVYAMLTILFIVSAWRTAEFLSTVLADTRFGYMTYLGLASFDGAFLAWHFAHDRASTPGQVGVAIVMWVVALVSMLGTNLGDILWTAQAGTLNADMQAMKTSIVNVLLLSIPILTVAHIAAGAVYLWLEPDTALAFKRRRALGEARDTAIRHRAATAKLQLRAEAAKQFAQVEQDILSLLEEAAAMKAASQGRRNQVWARLTGAQVPPAPQAPPASNLSQVANVPADGAPMVAATAPSAAPVTPGQNGHGHDPENIVPDGSAGGGEIDPFGE